MNIRVAKRGEYPSAWVSVEGQKYKAVIGRKGVTPSDEKTEGDGCTPIGKFKILGVYYRPDRLEKPQTEISVHEIASDDIWVDEPSHQLYNQPSKRSGVETNVSYEELWREDHLYDVFLDLGYNRNPAISGKGSAIFMHAARDQEKPEKTPTAGCVSLSRIDLLAIIARLEKNSSVEISP